MRSSYNAREFALISFIWYYKKINVNFMSLIMGNLEKYFDIRPNFNFVIDGICTFNDI